MHDFNSFLILCTGSRCRGPPKCWRSRTRSKIERSSRILWSWEHPRKKFGRNYLVWDTVWTINDSRKTENQGLSAPRAPDWSPWVDSPWNSSLVASRTMIGPHLGACCATHQTKLSQHKERCCPNFGKTFQGRKNFLSLSHTGTQHTKLTLWTAVGTVLSLLEKVHILRSTLRLDSSNLHKY